MPTIPLSAAQCPGLASGRVEVGSPFGELAETMPTSALDIFSMDWTASASEGSARFHATPSSQFAPGQNPEMECRLMLNMRMSRAML